jgi:hypothetical protein
MLPREILPPVIEKVPSDIVCSIRNVPSGPEVECELELLKRAASGFWYEEVHQYEGNHIETSEHAEASCCANLMHEHWKDKNKNTRTQQVNGHRDSHTCFSRNQREYFRRN